MLEEMLGPRDSRFTFGTVKGSSRNPHTSFPGGYHTGGGCVVNILIGQHPWDKCCYDQGTWQTAHECVHLLDPGVIGSANNLEEGLATWFQDEKRFHDEIVKRYIDRNKPHPENYTLAKQLVVRCQPEIFPAVKAIRSSGTRISEVTADVLGAHLPHVDRATIQRLCSRFE